MPSHLHPRSRATSTLFAGTLLASFAVVAVPHIWPCPRPRKQFLDSEIVIMDDGRAMRRVRKLKKPVSDSELSIEIPSPSPSPSNPADASQSTKMSNQQRKMQKEADLLQQLQAEAAARDQENARRPCPVPKPRGALGRLLGFEDASDTAKQVSR